RAPQYAGCSRVQVELTGNRREVGARLGQFAIGGFCARVQLPDVAAKPLDRRGAFAHRLFGRGEVSLELLELRHGLVRGALEKRLPLCSRRGEVLASTLQRTRRGSFCGVRRPESILCRDELISATVDECRRRARFVDTMSCNGLDVPPIEAKEC